RRRWRPRRLGLLSRPRALPSRDDAVRRHRAAPSGNHDRRGHRRGLRLLVDRRPQRRRLAPSAAPTQAAPAAAVEFAAGRAVAFLPSPPRGGWASRVGFPSPPHSAKPRAMNRTGLFIALALWLVIGVVFGLYPELDLKLASLFFDPEARTFPLKL